jgi:2-dehydro-3-deoxyphosphooctonate aldolase (KDO 8-P synthase)
MIEEKLTLIAGPCAIESEELCVNVAKKMIEVADKLGINYIFKASFDKANRSSIHSLRGLGIEKGLEILKKIKDAYNISVTTDIHESWQAAKVGEIVDIIQIPAFLCRQTDLLVAAAETGKIVNVKKAQFLAPWDMRNVVNKIKEAGCNKIWLTERGSIYGYNTLVVDYTGMLEMKKFGYPVVFDATHSVQKPGGLGESSGGNREYVEYLASAAVGMGIDYLFMEVHPDPDNAISDGPNQVRLDDIERILTKLAAIHKTVNEK